MKEAPLRFKDYKEMRAFLKGPKEFVEPERLKEEKHEVPVSGPDTKPAKSDTAKVGKSKKKSKKD